MNNEQAKREKEYPVVQRWIETLDGKPVFYQWQGDQAVPLLPVHTVGAGETAMVEMDDEGWETMLADAKRYKIRFKRSKGKITDYTKGRKLVESEEE